ncbi:hypothetical protein [Actinomadura sp. 9N407]|uniref:hypothetical protein n=1 Tax=Actinomadura sp. 9N407 TaxID=3375154 RepID=UPI0037A938F0
MTPRPEPRPYDRDLHARLIERLERALARDAPADWRRIDLKIRMTGEVSDVALTVVLKTGAVPPVEPSGELTEIAAELRSIMYRPGEGTWFGMRFMMDPPDTRWPDPHWVSYNRAFDPLWDPPLPREEWERDLAAFPRTGEHVPRWLRDRLQGPVHGQ